MVTHYRWVGLLEDLPASTTLLRHILPGIFGEQRSSEEPYNFRRNINPRQGGPLEAATRAHLLKSIASEVNLYSLAKVRLYCQLRARGIPTTLTLDHGEEAEEACSVGL